MDDFQRLPWQQREAIADAVREGRAVDDPVMATLAAEYAQATHDQLLRTALYVIAPLCLVAQAGVIWALSTRDEGVSIGEGLTAGVVGFTVMGLLFWAIALRPLARSRHANLHLAGLRPDGPKRREISHWVLAWFIAWPIAALVGLGLDAVGLDLAGVPAFAAWMLVLWGTKRALDDRAGG